MHHRDCSRALLLSLAVPGFATTAEAAPAPCKPGFVYREAYPNDIVCVPPATRTRVRADNAAAGSRVQPGGGAYGPNTCKSGFVWREARRQDLVCVSPAQRALAKADNQAAASRVVATRGQAPRPSGPIAEDVDGRPLPPGSSSLAQCKVGGAKCPDRMLPAYDEVSLSCLCKGQ